jgi:hypothetical protein
LLFERLLSAQARLGPVARHARLRAGLGGLASCVLLACGAPEPGELGQARDGVVYDQDDRREYFDVAEPEWRAPFEESLVALVPNRALARTADSSLRLVAQTWQEASKLCDGEPFGEQPGAAFCTGVLLDWDLVLTAGHCARQLAPRDFSFVLDYFYSAPGVLDLREDQVLRPAELVVDALDPSYAEPRLDFAWYRLQQPVSPPRRPAALRPQRAGLAAGDALVAIGTGGGVPLKLDAGAHVVDPRADVLDYFEADTDTSKGSSGSAAFDSEQALVGILSRGSADYEAQPEGCNKTARVTEPGQFEEFTYVQAALKALCAKDDTSELCGLSCDGACRVAERPEPRVRMHAVGGCCFTPGPAPASLAALLACLTVLVGARRAKAHTRASA